jgi:pectate lyase C
MLLAASAGCGEPEAADPASGPGGAGGGGGSGLSGGGGGLGGSTGGAGSAAAAGSMAGGAGGADASAGVGGDGAGTGGSAGGAAGSTGGAGGAGSGGSGGAGAGTGGVGDAGSGGAGGAGGMGGSAPVIGEGGTVNATIVVQSGQTYDGENKRFRAGSALGDGSQDEGQQPVFRVEDGGRLINVVIGAPAADGIHIYGDATLSNIVWEDIGEDALTIKESGTVVLDGGSATNGEDKVFQINAASTFRLSNFTASNAGKLIRQNGGTTFEVEVYLDDCDISNMDEAIFRTDSDSSSLTMNDTRYSDIGDAVFIRHDAADTYMGMGNTEY